MVREDADRIGKLESKIRSLEAQAARLNAEHDQRIALQTEELRRSEQRYRALVEATSDWVWEVDRNAIYTYVSPKVKETLGYEISEVLGKTPFEFMPPREAERAAAAFSEHLEKRTAFAGLINTVERIDGLQIVTETSGVPILDDNGDLVGYRGIDRDITDIHRSEEAFRNIVQSSPMGIHMYELEKDGRLVFRGANPATDRMLGVDASQFVGKTIEEAFPPLAETEIPERYRQAAADGTPWSSRQVDYKDEQIEGAYEVHVFQTEPNHAAVMFSDITDRLRAEEALRHSEHRHRSLFETMAQGVIYQDRAGKIIASNPAAERILGLRSEEMATRTSSDPKWRALREDGSEFPGDQHPAMVALREGRPADAVMGVYNPEVDEYRWIDIHSIPQFREGESEPYQVFASFTDITDRVTSETEKDRLQEQLTQAQKMEAIGRLAGGIAHDFNNLLTAIRGYSELVLKNLDSESTLREDVEEIRRAGERATALTHQLLAFSRKQVISPRKIDLNSTIRESRRMLGRIVGEDVTLQIRTDRDLGTVRVDPHQIEQILVNLVANSRDAMPEGGTLVIETQNIKLEAEHCRAFPEFEPGSYVMVSISDTGTGMAESIRDRVFEPFFTTKEHGKGTGLGLSTVYGIVKQNRGFINIYSEPEAGTTFNIYLPRIEAKADAVEDPAAESSLTGSETIMLVEDEETVRTLARKVLTSMGYLVLEAIHGEDALLLSSDYRDKIHLLLTDVIMPFMTGKELYRRLRDERPDLKVIYMSGYSEDVIAHHGVLEQETVFIQKPFSTEILGRKIRDILDLNV